MEIKDKKILVTGGAGGIGSALVEMLLAKGAVAGVVDNQEDRLKALSSRIPKSKSHQLVTYPIDVGEPDRVQETVAHFYKQQGAIDGLVNNASVLKDSCLISILAGKINKHSQEVWETTLRSNLYGAFYFAREVAEKMVIKRTRGVIVNISSVSAAGNPGQTSYAASKAALNALTVTWAAELSLFGIRVAGLAPGMTDTQMPRQAMKESTLDAWVEKVPLKRLATPEEIAQGIIFILENDYFCGRILEIDGGLRM